MGLFQQGELKLAAGGTADWKIECDALTDDDWSCIAKMISRRFNYSRVFGVPRGGAKLAALLEPAKSEHCRNVIIVDDVYTTGKSMDEYLKMVLRMGWPNDTNFFGIAVFARRPINPRDRWIQPVFQYWQ